jgi:hypothetical protein
LATVSVTVNMNLSSTSIRRSKVRPMPLSWLSTTGWPGDSTEPAFSVQTVLLSGRPARFCPCQPFCAK